LRRSVHLSLSPDTQGAPPHCAGRGAPSAHGRAVTPESIRR
jgi:hypothetical protein